jgi:alpha,alpha-trehalase
MRCGRFSTFSIHFRSLLWLVSFLLFKPLGAQKAIPVEPYIAEAQQYYIENWKKSLRTLTHDSADFIGLPYPYSTPTLAGNQMFREMYYWDSYFINCGLLAYGSHPQRDGESTADEKLAIQQAINNCNNLIYLVNKFGFVPNANRFSMTNRSQPPLLGAMINDIFDVTSDTAWLRKALSALEKEHHWWMANRSLNLSPSEYAGIKAGKQDTASLRLNHYGNSADDAFLLRFSKFLSGRLGPKFDSLYLSLNLDSFVGGYGQKRPKGLRLASHLLAEAESGWDFTTRFNARCMSIAPLDLNCLLYLSEKTLATGYKTLKEHNKSREWQRKRKIRKALINKLFYDKHTGWYWDYDLAKREINFNHNAAQFMPYFVSLVKHNSRNKTALARLSNIYIGKFGVHPCLPLSKDSSAIAANRVLWKTQWDSPNAWPPLTHFAAQAIENYAKGQGKLTNLMLNIKRNQLIISFMESVEVQFAITQKFWEKYNIDYGTLQVVNEYPMPDFFGWTAGVYMEYRIEFEGH